MRYATVMATVLIVGGCVSAGTNFDPAQVSLLRPGMTETAVFSRLGPPNSHSSMANGEEVLVWLHSRGTAWGAGDARSVSLLFDEQKKLVRVLNQTETHLK
jgi:hypothetical protein